MFTEHLTCTCRSPLDKQRPQCNARTTDAKHTHTAVDSRWRQSLETVAGGSRSSSTNNEAVDDDNTINGCFPLLFIKQKMWSWTYTWKFAVKIMIIAMSCIVFIETSIKLSQPLVPSQFEISTELFALILYTTLLYNTFHCFVGSLGWISSW